MPYNIARYDAVLDACALKPDLMILPDGDLTDIGEKVSVRILPTGDLTDIGEKVSGRRLPAGDITDRPMCDKVSTRMMWSGCGISAYYPRVISQT